MAVAAPGALAARAALDTATAGGNAVDAALAAMVTAMSTEPGIVSVLGGAYLTIWRPGSPPEVVDGNAEMPGRGLPRERFGQGIREVHTTYGGGLTLYAGPGSAATPGAFSAFFLAHERHGGLGWETVLAPAIAAARSGYPIGSAAASYLALTGERVFGWDPESRVQVTRSDGRAVAPGDRLRNLPLAAALEQVAAEGAQTLYTGELGRRLAADMATRGGLITEADLAEYRPIVRTPLLLDVGGWQVATNPPPSIGGPMLAVMLAELARRDPWDWAEVIEIQRAVLGHRSAVLDVAPDLERAGWEVLDQVERHGLAGLPTSSSTAHVSVVDSDGLACAITASSGYGSGATLPGTGMLLNNCLGEPELNRRGLHALAPGTRMASNMAPSVAMAPDGRVLAVGTPGADRITTALMQVLGRYCLRGEPLQAAIDRPRVHVRVLEDSAMRIDHEESVEISSAATASALPVTEHPGISMFFGGVGAAELGSDGVLRAFGDPRRASAVGVTEV